MIRTVEDWRAAIPALKRRGAEWVGPCPRCGGNDRFHVRPGAARGGAVVGCRGCIDGLEPGARARRYGEIARAVFPNDGRPGERGGERRTRPRDPVPVSEPARPAQRGATTAAALAVWDAGEMPDDGSCPARRYLAGRWAWPPLPAPPSIRWVPAARWPDAAPALPSDAAGALAFAFDHPADGDLAAV